MSRWGFARGLALVAGLTAACEPRASTSGGPATPATAATAATTTTPAAPPSATAGALPLGYVERCVAASCEAELPLVLALHGLGDRPEAFVGLYDALPVPARVLALRAPLPHGQGFAWFPFRAADVPPGEVAAAMDALVPRVRATVEAVCAARRCDGRVVVSGFSQGGMMSFALAARAPDFVDAAFPVAGFLPPGLAVRASSLPVVAFHGDADGVVPLAWDEQGLPSLRAAGLPVQLRRFPGVAHRVPPEVRSALLEAIGLALLDPPRD